MTSDENDHTTNISRRAFLRDMLRGSLLLGLGGVSGMALLRGRASHYVWQIDPDKCVQCDRCRTACVLSPSAVKAVKTQAICGYCELCGGFHRSTAPELNTGAENRLCPTGAIKRNFVEDPYYEYVVDEKLCTGCSKCVKGCADFGNGSLYLQVRHSICVNCNDCAIARVCPSNAFRRVPASDPYLLKRVKKSG